MIKTGQRFHRYDKAYNSNIIVEVVDGSRNINGEYDCLIIQMDGRSYYRIDSIDSFMLTDWGKVTYTYLEGQDKPLKEI